MKKSSFLNKTWKQKKINLVEPSENICNSYIKKAENSLKSANILIKNDLYEDSIPKSYYTMYNILLALLFKTGIKSENHSASILILKLVFKKNKQYQIISYAKKERIKKQYYTDSTTTKSSAKELQNNAEEFLINIKLFIKNIKESEIRVLRNRLKTFTK